MSTAHSAEHFANSEIQSWWVIGGTPAMGPKGKQLKLRSNTLPDLMFAVGSTENTCYTLFFTCSQKARSHVLVCLIGGPIWRYPLGRVKLSGGSGMQEMGFTAVEFLPVSQRLGFSAVRALMCLNEGFSKKPWA